MQKEYYGLLNAIIEIKIQIYVMETTIISRAVLSYAKTGKLAHILKNIFIKKKLVQHIALDVSYSHILIILENVKNIIMKSIKAKEFIKMEEWEDSYETNSDSIVLSSSHAIIAVELAEQDMREKAIVSFCDACGDICEDLSTKYCEKRNKFINLLNN